MGRTMTRRHHGITEMSAVIVEEQRQVTAGSYMPAMMLAPDHGGGSNSERGLELYQKMDQSSWQGGVIVTMAMADKKT